ncbi:MAG: glycosyltransferase family 4 protein [Bacteroidota bacterium]|nr:glycosyltransferase family 4 protein [Bacteroidota bacterium]
MADDITFMMRTKPISGNKKFTLVPREIKVVNVPNFKTPKAFFTKRRIAKNIVESQVKKSDIVVLRTQSSIAQLALEYIKKYNKPYIIECVGCSWDSYWNHSLLGKIVAPYMYYKTKKAIKNAPYVYYVTKEFLQKRYPTKGKTVSCSNVVLDKLDKLVLERRLEKISKFDPRQRLVLGTAAAIDTRYKGHEYVIKAIPKLVKLGYNVEYRLAGGVTGQKPNTFLKDLAVSLGVNDRVVFCGSLSAKEIMSYYDDLDIYVQPSKQEGLPRAVIEAMSRGCPCIGTDIAGIPELLPDLCLFKKGRYDEIIKTLGYLLESDLAYLAMENYKHAKLYEREKLNRIREEFYYNFMIENNLLQR